MVREDGSVISIYSHWDGYPTHHGDILLNNYMDAAKVASLIALGSISTLAENVDPDPKGGEIVEYDYTTGKATRKPSNGVHTFDNPQEGVVVAYGRDRGEDPNDVKPFVQKTVNAFVKGDVEEWGYLFKDGKWFVVDGHVAKRNRKLVELTMDNLQTIENASYD